MLKKLRRLPVWVAVALMCLMIFAGITLGNRNALSAATGSVYSRLETLRARVEVMASKASNYLTIANRIGIKGQSLDSLKSAQSDAKQIASRPVGAHGRAAASVYIDAAGELNQAMESMDAALREAISSLPADSAERKSEETARVAAYNAWRDEAPKLIEKQNYNDAAEDFSKLYYSLPARMLLRGYNYPIIKY